MTHARQTIRLLHLYILLLILKLSSLHETNASKKSNKWQAPKTFYEVSVLPELILQPCWTFSANRLCHLVVPSFRHGTSPFSMWAQVSYKKLLNMYVVMPATRKDSKSFPAKRLHASPSSHLQ